MKKTFTINISGTVFHIDDDAYERLNNYIAQINRHFRNDADAREIVEDIESRISELFQSRVKDGKEVITVEQVEEIIQIMGLPEAFDDAREGEGEEVKSKIPSRPSGRKLYRDPDDRVLGGVCSGLGAFFNFDPVVIRLIFVLLVFLGAGSSLFIYLILWIVVPKAANTAQRLEMRGEEVNINNISKNIKEEIQDVKDNYEKFKSTRSYARGRERMDQAGSLMSSVLSAFFKIIVVIVGIALLFAGIIAIIALFTSLFISKEFLGLSPFAHGMPHYLDLFVSSATVSWLWVGFGLAIGIPLIMLAYLGIKLIFRFKSSNGSVALIALGLWVIGIIILISTLVRGFSDFKNVSTNTRQETITTKSDTLYLKLGADEFSDYLESDLNIDGLRIASLNGKEFLLNEPRLDIEKSETNDFSLLVKVRARGHDLNKAQNNARDISYKYNQQDSLITFQPWFMLPDKSGWHNQKVEVTLMVPVNKTIFLSNEMVRIIHDVQNTSETWDGDMGGKYWTMKSNGLELAQLKPVPVVMPKKIKK